MPPIVSSSDDFGKTWADYIKANEKLNSLAQDSQIKSHVGVMVRDPELDRNGKYMAVKLNIINHLLFTAD